MIKVAFRTVSILKLLVEWLDGAFYGLLSFNFCKPL